MVTLFQMPKSFDATLKHGNPMLQGHLLRSAGYTQRITEQRCLIPGKIDKETLDHLTWGMSRREKEVESVQMRKSYLRDRCLGGQCRQRCREQPALVVSRDDREQTTEMKTIRVFSECFFEPASADHSAGAAYEKRLGKTVDCER